MKKDGNKCFLFKKEYVNRAKSVVIYTEDLENNGNLVFNVDYDIQYSNGEGQHGNAMVDLEDVLKAYNLRTFNEVVENLKARYENDEKAWQKNVSEMKGKGLDVCDDENESCENENGFYMTNL